MTYQPWIALHCVKLMMATLRGEFGPQLPPRWLSYQWSLGFGVLHFYQHQHSSGMCVIPKWLARFERIWSDDMSLDIFIGEVRWSAESIQIFGDRATDYEHRFYSRNTQVVRFDNSCAYKQVGDFLPQIRDELLLCRFYYQKERWQLWSEGETHSDHLAKLIICADSLCVSPIKISFFFLICTLSLVQQNILV